MSGVLVYRMQKTMRITKALCPLRPTGHEILGKMVGHNRRLMAENVMVERVYIRQTFTQ